MIPLTDPLDRNEMCALLAKRMPEGDPEGIEATVDKALAGPVGKHVDFAPGLSVRHGPKGRLTVQAFPAITLF